MTDAAVCRLRRLCSGITSLDLDCSLLTAAATPELLAWAHDARLRSLSLDNCFNLPGEALPSLTTASPVLRALQLSDVGCDPAVYRTAFDSVPHLDTIRLKACSQASGGRWLLCMVDECNRVWVCAAMRVRVPVTVTGMCRRCA